jgi:threonine dehydrogenase-like Zn-dependent dehydrogenase
MKARSIEYGNNGGVRLIELEVPEPGHGEALVEGLACGVCAADVAMFQHGPYSWGRHGHEGVGRVVRLGPAVTQVKVGDRVSGGGLGFSQWATVPAAELCLINDPELPDEECLLEPVACAVNGLDHCRLRVGDRVALIGCGFMGAMILQGLLRSFAERVIVIEKEPARLALARQLGAREAYSPADADWPRQLEALKALSLDTVVDCTGAQAGLDLATQLCRRGGLINLFGWNKGPRNFDANTWHLMGLTIVNSSPSAGTRETFPVAARALRAGIIKLKPLISHVVTLDEYPALLEQAARVADGYVKGVVRLKQGGG